MNGNGNAIIVITIENRKDLKLVMCYDLIAMSSHFFNLATIQNLTILSNKTLIGCMLTLRLKIYFHQDPWFLFKVVGNLAAV